MASRRRRVQFVTIGVVVRRRHRRVDRLACPLCLSSTEFVRSFALDALWSFDRPAARRSVGPPVFGGKRRWKLDGSPQHCPAAGRRRRRDADADAAVRPNWL